MTTDIRFAKILVAPPDTLAIIDSVLDGTAHHEPASVRLFTLSGAARQLNLSRSSVWRMVKCGSIRTVKIRDNAKRIAETELIRIARGIPLDTGGSQ